MKEPRSTPLEEIRKAIGDPLAMGAPEATDFLTRYDAGEIDVPSLPPHLLPAPLARAIAKAEAGAAAGHPAPPR
jgi:hypothetical protein